MAQTLRFGIAGLGVASTQILAAFENRPHLQVTAAADVRPHALKTFEQEYEGEGRIPGSKLIPLNQLSWRRDELPTGRPVAVVCLTGARSTLAALALRTAGLDKVWVLTGGLAAWRQAGPGPLAE